MRRAIIALAGNRAMAGLASRHGLSLGASRFVAGETLDQAIGVSRMINGDGRAVTLDVLGESVNDESRARAAADAGIEVLEAISREGIKGNLSVKPTQLGLNLNPDLCFQNLRRIAGRASELDSFVRIDMESSAHTEDTIRIFKTLRSQFNNLGLAIQAYLYRSEDDLLELQKMGANIRLIKGAYAEPPEVAYQSKPEVDSNFKRLISLQLESGCYTAVATHDDDAITFTIDYVKQRGITRDRFEFQMLYGIRTSRQVELARAGYRTRVYVPFGRDWYPYLVRRLAERPANLWFILKNLF